MRREVKKLVRMRKIKSKKTGILREISAKGGEQVTEVTFRTSMACNGGTASFIQTLSSSTVPTLLAGTQFVEFFNTTPASSLFSMFRVVKFGLKVAPIVAGTITLRSASGAYGVGPYSGSASGPGSAPEVLNMADSLSYAAPGYNAALPYDLVGPLWCSKADRSINYTLADSESLWSNRVLTQTVAYGDIVYWGFTAAQITSNVELYITVQFKGIAPQ
jgi:hypothetical protein